MPQFDYQGRNDQGELVRGSVESDSQRLVAKMLLNSGVTPVQITENEEPPDIGEQLDAVFQFNKPKLIDLVMFCKQMYTLVKSGVPIIRAMSGLAETTRNPKLKGAIEDIVNSLEAGHSLTQAFHQHPKVFPRLLVSTIHVGENAGRLDLAFKQVAAYLEHEMETQSRIKSALRYPTMVLVAIGVAMVIINLFVIPSFAGVFESFDAELPLPTKILIATSNGMQAYWPHLLVLMGIGWWWVYRYVQTDEGRFAWDRSKLKLPLVGSIIYKASLSRFTRSFEMMLSSGVPLIEGITIVAQAVGNEYLGEKILAMRSRIEGGDALSTTAAASGMFPPLVLQMISVGEETGNVAAMMGEVSEYYDREVDAELTGLSSAIEPIMIVVIGLMVLVLALGVFLPMWELGGAAQGR